MNDLLIFPLFYGVPIAITALMMLPTRRCYEDGTALLALWAPWTAWHLAASYVIAMLWHTARVRLVDPTNVGIALFAIPSLATFLGFLFQLPAWVVKAYRDHEGVEPAGARRTTRKVFDVYRRGGGRVLLLAASALGLWAGLTDVY